MIVVKTFIELSEVVVDLCFHVLGAVFLLTNQPKYLILKAHRGGSLKRKPFNGGSFRQGRGETVHRANFFVIQ